VDAVGSHFRLPAINCLQLAGLLTMASDRFRNVDCRAEQLQQTEDPRAILSAFEELEYGQSWLNYIIVLL